MANAAIVYENLLPGATLSGAAVSSLPVANLVDDQPSKVARWSGAAASFTADLLSAQEVGAVALAGTNLTSTATLRVRMGTDGVSWAFDTGIIDPQAKPELNGLAAYLFPGAGETYRYLRCDIADASLSYIDIGHAIAGPVFEPAINFEWDWLSSVTDLSATQGGDGGQLYVRRRPKLRGMALSFKALSKAEIMGDVRRMQRIAGTSKNVLVVAEPGDAYEAENRIVGLLQEQAGVQQPFFDIWTWNFRLVERV